MDPDYDYDDDDADAPELDDDLLAQVEGDDD